jgi:hypothetical protein
VQARKLGSKVAQVDIQNNAKRVLHSGATLTFTGLKGRTDAELCKEQPDRNGLIEITISKIKNGAHTFKALRHD